MLRRSLFVALLALFCLPALAQADRAFTPRFSTNDTGNIIMAGNTLMTCPASASGCVAARNADSTNIVKNDALNNNSYDMQYVDQDGAAFDTFNSSRATLTVPTGATVLFAGLYYGGDFSTGSAAPPNKGARDQVKFRAPGDAGYTLLTGSVIDDSTLNVGRYQGFQDVTARVKAAGSGSYAVGDVQSGKGSDHYAGWSIIVVYRDTTEPARNLTVFDGLKTIRTTDPPTDIPVSGFRTPPAGPVRTALGFVTYEGDLGLVGDGAALNGVDLGDANSPKTNFFNSTIANLGGRFSAKDPDDTNQLGYDADIFNADGILANNATSATIRVKTAGDQYLPGAITFATELFAPRIEQTKTATDVNGGTLEQGDTVEYTIAGKNTGQDSAVNFQLSDAIPANTTYVLGSLKTGTDARSDAADTDTAEFDGAGKQVRFRLGNGANGTQGGRIAPDGTYSATFRVRVERSVPTGTKIPNTARATFTSDSLGTPLTAESSADVILRSPDLAIKKTRVGALKPGSPVTYTLAVKNVGEARVQAGQPVTVTDTLPAGLTYKSAAGTGWTCANSGQIVTCTRADELAAGASYGVITIAANAAKSVRGKVENTATVAGGGDANPANNSDSNTADAGGAGPNRAALSIKKTVKPGSVAGGRATYVLEVRNAGPASAKKVKLSDPLPAGVAFAAVRPGAPTCRERKGTVSCSFGTLKAGASKTVEIVVTTALGNPPASHDHQLPVDKVEVDIPLEPGQEKTVELACGAGRLMTDASVRTDAVDQGTGTPGSVEVLRTESTAPNTYVVTVRNTATGRAQTKAFGVCIPMTTTETRGHTHDLVLTGPVARTASLPQGRSDLEVQCAPGSEPVAPGFSAVGAPVRLVASEPTPQGWRFGLEVTGGASDVIVQVRCLNRRTAVTDGHAHNLQLDHIVRQLDVPAGATVSESVICGDQSKGIVGSMDLTAGLVPLGNDPQPKTRVFKLFNPTGGALRATIDLTCLGDRVGGPVVTEQAVVNTATVTSSTPDDDLTDNTSSVTLNADGTSGASAPRVMVGTSSLRVAGGRRPQVKIPLTCRSATSSCRGLVVLRATSSLRVGSKRVKRGQGLAGVRYAVRASSRGTVTVRLSRPVAKALRRKRVRSISVDVLTTKNQRVTRKVLKLRR